MPLLLYIAAAGSASFPVIDLNLHTPGPIRFALDF